MLKTAIDHPGPISLRYPRGEGWGVALDKDMKTLEIGKAEILRQGGDVVIAAIGHTVLPALKAAAELAPLGIDASVVNARFVKPLDKNLFLDMFTRVSRMIIFYYHLFICCFFSGLIEFLCD